MIDLTSDTGTPDAETPDAETPDAETVDGGAVEATDDQLRSRIAAGLASNLDGIAGEIERAVLEAVPGYRRLAQEPGGAEALSDSLRQVVDIFIGLVQDPEEWSRLGTTVVFDVGTDVGRRRAGQGLSLAEVQKASHLALKVGLRQLRTDVKALGVTDSTFEVSGQIAEALHDYVNDFSSGVATGFLEVRQHEAEAGAESRSELLAQILDGGLSDRARIEALAHEAGVPRLAPCTMLVVATRGTHGLAALAEPMAKLCEGVERALRSSVRTSPTPHGVALIPHKQATSWSDLLRRARGVAERWSLVIVAHQVEDAFEAASDYAWICDLLAVPSARSVAGIVEIEDLVEQWLVDATLPGSDFRFVRWALGAALGGDAEASAPLLQVARAYVDAEGVMMHAAEMLGLDHRTASKRRRQFEALTGLSLGDPGHRHLVHHALRLLELRQATLPDLGAPEWGSGARTLRHPEARL